MTERDAARGAVERLAEQVERGATTAEEIHRAIAKVPFETLEHLGAFPQTRDEVQRIHDEALGAIYDLVRSVNKKVARLASDLVEPRGEWHDVP